MELNAWSSQLLCGVLTFYSKTSIIIKAEKASRKDGNHSVRGESRNLVHINPTITNLDPFIFSVALELR